MRESLGPNDQAPMKGIDVERKGEEGLLCGWGQRGCKVGGEWACLELVFFSLHSFFMIKFNQIIVLLPD